MLPANKAVNNRKNARDRSVNVNSANARNKAAGVAAKSVAAANKADDKPGYVAKKRRELAPAALLGCRSLKLPMLPPTGPVSNPDEANPNS